MQSRRERRVGQKEMQRACACATRVRKRENRQPHVSQHCPKLRLSCNKTDGAELSITVVAAVRYSDGKNQPSRLKYVENARDSSARALPRWSEYCQRATKGTASSLSADSHTFAKNKLWAFSISGYARTEIMSLKDGSLANHEGGSSTSRCYDATTQTMDEERAKIHKNLGFQPSTNQVFLEKHK